MELRCNSSDSSTNSNACLTPGPPCCEMYSSRFASAARFTTTHLRNGGIVRAMCHNASIGVFGSLADCGVSARGGGGGCSRPLFGVCAVCSVLANRFALLRRRGACDAVRDAVKNAKCNNVKNIEFYNADAGQFMVEMAEYRADAKRGEKSGADEVDVVFMDPPRAGSDEAFLSSVVTLAPKRVVYVSCNPETLARDLLYLTKHGYRAQECQPVDMFPWTKHVESVVLMQYCGK